MAFVLSVALVLSVLFIPNTSAAKEGDPTVKVLGATLRLGDTDNSGKQSMRIGIQIDGANKASACAIQLTVGTKTYTVASKAGIGGDVVQSTLHSSDIDNNSVIYAVNKTIKRKEQFVCKENKKLQNSYNILKNIYKISKKGYSIVVGNRRELEI